MKVSKTKNIFARGRKFALTLALFLLVFAIASMVKVWAGSEDSASGWMWGGGSGVPGDGTNTNVGWISMNSSNCDADNNGLSDGAIPGCPVAGTPIPDYGVNIPSIPGLITGYAWSENIGWISFNAADLSGCPSGECDARREDGNLKGWARILGIKDALAVGNSGGWEGWISLDDKSGSGKYGVELSKMIGSADSHTYAWSASSSGAGELGWIDFGLAKFEEQCSISITPSVTANANSTPTVTISRDKATGSPLTVSLASSDNSKLTVPSSATIPANQTDAIVNVSVKSFSGGSSSCTDGPFQITANACGMGQSSDVIIQRTCAITCSPAKNEVAAGGSGNFTAANSDYDNNNFNWSYSDPNGCVDSSTSSGSDNSSYKVVSKQQGNGGASCAYKAIDVTASGSCCGKDTCTLNFGQAGWIETNP